MMTPYRKLRGETLTLVQSLLLIVGTHQLKQQRALRAAVGTRSLGFERVMLGVVAIFVVGLISTAYLRPPAETTRLPMAAIFVQPQAEDAGEMRTVAVMPEIEARAPAVMLPAVAISQSQGLVKVPLPKNKPTFQEVTAAVLSDTFSTLGYDFQSVLDGKIEVPRLFLASLPGDMSDLSEVKTKKALFLQSMLPLILQVNEEILNARARALKISAIKKTGARIPATDRLWLAVMTDKYDLARDNLKGLINRLDTVPVSLALAQAASESGWGTSRFVREGNALFGEWTFSGEADGIKPSDRDEGKIHRVRAFSSLLDSVRAYVMNLNTHRAYKGFRTLRARLRHSGAPLDGNLLAGTLKHYSERGEVYVSELRTIIDYNGLDELDNAKLSAGESLI